MKQAVEFIILGTTKVGEKSLVLHTLSASYGRRSFIVSVSKSSAMALYLPLNILSGEITLNAKSDLWRVSGLKAEYALAGIRSSVLKNSVCLFMSEVLYRVLRDGEYSVELYEWCRQQILLLDGIGDDFANFHLLWLLGLCGELGFSPRMEDLMPFAGERLDDLRGLLSLPYDQALLLPLSGARRSEIAEILLEYLSYHLDSRLNIRSLPVLRELFA